MIYFTNRIPCDDPIDAPNNEWRACQYPERPMDGHCNFSAHTCPRCRIAFIARAMERPDALVACNDLDAAQRLGIVPGTPIPFVLAARCLAEMLPVDDPDRVHLLRIADSVTADAVEATAGPRSGSG